MGSNSVAGQAVVQIAEDTETHEQYAIKFFVSKTAFEQVCVVPQLFMNCDFLFPSLQHFASRMLQ